MNDSPASFFLEGPLREPCQPTQSWSAAALAADSLPNLRRSCITAPSLKRLGHSTVVSEDDLTKTLIKQSNTLADTISQSSTVTIKTKGLERLLSAGHVPGIVPETSVGSKVILTVRGQLETSHYASGNDWQSLHPNPVLLTAGLVWGPL